MNSINEFLLFCLNLAVAIYFKMKLYLTYKHTTYIGLTPTYYNVQRISYFIHLITRSKLKSA